MGNENLKQPTTKGPANFSYLNRHVQSNCCVKRGSNNMPSEDASWELSARVARGSFIILVNRLITTVLGVVYTIMAARLLGAEGYGVVSVGLALLSVLMVVGSFGIYGAIVRYVSKYAALNRFRTVRRVLRISFKYLLALALGFSLALLVLAGPIATHIYHDPGLTNVFRTVALILFLWIIFNGFQSVFQGFQRMRYILFAQVTYATLRIPIAIGLISAGFFATGALLGTAGGLIVAGAFSLFFLIPKVLPKSRSREAVDDRGLSREVLSFAAPTWLGSVAVILLTYFGTLLLGYVVNMQEVGYYSAAFYISIFLVALPGVMAGALFPALSEQWTLGRRKNFALAVRTAIKLIFTILIPLVVGMMIFSEFTLTLLYGGEFVAGANMLRMLLIAMLFRSLSEINYSIFSGIGRPDVYAKLGWMAAVVGVAAITPMVWLYGGMGAASGLLVACVCWALAGAYFVTRLTHQDYPFPIFWRPLLATGAMLLFVIPMRFVVGNIFQAAIVGLVGFVVYAYAFLRLGGVGKADLEVLKRISSGIGKPRAVEKVLSFLEHYTK